MSGSSREKVQGTGETMHVLESRDISAGVGLTLICRVANHKVEVVSRVATCGQALHVVTNDWSDVDDQFWSYTLGSYFFLYFRCLWSINIYTPNSF